MAAVYEVVSTESNPLPPEVLRNPFEVRFERAFIIPAPKLKLVEKRLVEEELVLKRFVVVAEVLVELIAVKFKRVELPESKRLEREVNPPVAVRVPVKLAAEEIV